MNYKALSFLFLLVLSSAAQADAIDLNEATPPSAAMDSCDENAQSAWQKFIHHFFSPSYCFGPLVESEAIDSQGARTIYALSKSTDLSDAIKHDKSLIADLIGKDLIRPYVEDHPKYLKELKSPTLRFLYGEDSGVTESHWPDLAAVKYTIGQHSERVLNLFFEQARFNDFNALETTNGVRSTYNLLYYTLAFHDIGKSIPAKVSHKEREVEFSAPLARDLMLAAGFNSAETDLSVALIEEHQLIGSYLRGFISLQQTSEKLKARANQLGLSPLGFYKLLEIIYVADAGSYPSLISLVFERDSRGQLTIKAQDAITSLLKTL